MENRTPIIVWFRNDLRISDHTALYHAAKTGAPIIPVFIYDKNAMGQWDYGAAQKFWLQNSLKSLSSDLLKLGAELVIRRGDTIINLLQMAKETGAKQIFALRNYEPWACEIEINLKEAAADEEIEFKRFSGNCLIEPESLKNQSGNHFQVFTPFFKTLFAAKIRKPFPKPEKINGLKTESEKLDDWRLLPTHPDWTDGFTKEIGENAAHNKLETFLNGAIANYGAARDFPSLKSTSRLAPHLRFGEISPAQIWWKVFEGTNNNPQGDYYKFLSELGWREFSNHLLIHYPNMPCAPIKTQFANMPWRDDANRMKAWKKGQTGFPIIDAGMRELWATGYMHNRVRMIVASFLVKHLLIDWREGAGWFWDCLLDGDLANNSASWQWVAGSGMDAAPYFRIFNPITQSQKFDKDGEYLRKWLPELSRLNNSQIHAPFEASVTELKAAGVILGQNYPMPIIDLKMGRERALAALNEIKA